MKYKSKPKIIEAEQLTRMMASVVVDWIGKDNIEQYNLGEFAEDRCYIEIKMLEGMTTASEDDYVIKGIHGEFYACKPDIFHKSYELLDEKK